MGLDDLFVTVYLGAASAAGWGSTRRSASCWSASACWPSRRGGRGPAARRGVGRGRVVDRRDRHVVAVRACGRVVGARTAGARTCRWRCCTGATMVVLAVGMLALTWQRIDRGGQWLAMPAGAVTLGAAVLVWVAVTDREPDRLEVRHGPCGGGAGRVHRGVGGVRGVDGAARRTRPTARGGQRDPGCSSSWTRYRWRCPSGPGAAAPYYANNEAERLLGPSVHAEIVDGDLPGLYRAYVAGHRAAVSSAGHGPCPRGPRGARPPGRRGDPPSRRRGHRARGVGYPDLRAAPERWTTRSRRSPTCPTARPRNGRCPTRRRCWTWRTTRSWSATPGR